MSHFTVGVILPNNEENTNSYLTHILDPFDENKEVTPYPDECHCVGIMAKIHGGEMATAYVGNYHDLILEGSRDQWRETRQDYIDYHPLCGKPDPNCEDCSGTGIRMSTYNQNRKWDWWTIGGRWNNHLPNRSNFMQCSDLLTNRTSRRPAIDPDLLNHDFFRIKYESDVAQYEATPEDIRDLYVPFALLTPDGFWYEKGDMGWFAIVVDEKDLNSWLKVGQSIYQQYSDHTLVLIDCHI